MPTIGPLELAIVLVIALVVLGPKKLPEVGRSVGKGMREFKNSIAGKDDGAPVELRDSSASAAAPEATVTTDKS